MRYCHKQSASVVSSLELRSSFLQTLYQAKTFAHSFQYLIKILSIFQYTCIYFSNLPQNMTYIYDIFAISIQHYIQNLLTNTTNSLMQYLFFCIICSIFFHFFDFDEFFMRILHKIKISFLHNLPIQSKIAKRN